MQLHGLKDELDCIDKEREGISDGEDSGCKSRKQDILDAFRTQDGYRVRLGESRPDGEAGAGRGWEEA